ncbi:metal-binding protein [Corynebacterium sp. HMSC06D04]|uniref:ComEC/Rec2 family competence protein n=1 Tax=Corynebacterium sp. HMSC06D04 TaxID=1581123 RepID=UPI0008A25ABE|nr:ComEC/Rec2 family competence protein [Corynebacterium sp. HMSC06D04]OFT50855.1 metal-binding protein [Corynebacterium sp. HMSC06D04]
MRQLRLLPAACAVWLATLLSFNGAWCSLVPLVCLVLWFWQRGQAVLTTSLSALAIAVTKVRISRAGPLGDVLTGTVITEPTEVRFGWLLRLRVPGYPFQVPVFSDEPAPAGAQVTVDHGTITSLTPPDSLAAHVAENFRELVSISVGPSSQGLLPGMVLGDTTLQTAAEKQLYIDTGLSHLSAVSGSNVAIVCSAAALLVKGPRLRVAASLSALCIFVALVGFEPSVQRAAVMGLVGLLAVLNSARMEPMHGLSLAIIVLLFIDSELAKNFGFALSVAATAGIVALSPLLYRHLAVIGWPDIFVRALAVAIAADLVTMPIIALMSGKVSVVSVLANVLVAPATAPVTILGLLAALFAQLGPLSVLGAGVLRLAEPFTWWINTIARGCAALPVSTVDASPFLVLLGYGWIVAGILYKRPLLTLACVVAFLWPRHIDTPQEPIHVVATEEDIEPIPPGTRSIIVTQDSPPDYPTRTADGIAVFYR